jgi:type III restriction enzyme
MPPKSNYPTPVAAHKHRDKRADIPTEELRDFVADGGHDPDELLNLILERTSQRKKDKAAKVTTAQTLWIPAVNNHGEFGRWNFLEICDSWDAAKGIRQFVEKRVQTLDKTASSLKALT